MMTKMTKKFVRKSAVTVLAPLSLWLPKKVIRVQGVHLAETAETGSGDHAVKLDPMDNKVNKDLMANVESAVPREL